MLKDFPYVFIVQGDGVSKAFASYNDAKDYLIELCILDGWSEDAIADERVYGQHANRFIEGFVIH